MPANTATIRKVILLLFILAMLTMAALLLGTERGYDFLRHPHQHGEHVRQWVLVHPYSAPLLFLGVFVALGTVALPVWWLQILAGFGFGLVMGMAWSIVGSELAALAGATLSRYLLGDWFHTRVESQLARVRKLDEKMGHNGLLVVCAVRLVHFIPAGLANLAMGLTRISLIDIAVGTFIGCMPATSILVTIGAAKHRLHDWRFVTALITLNLVLLAFVGLRYLKPHWFKTIGVE